MGGVLKSQVPYRAAGIVTLALVGLASAGCGANPKPHGKLVLNGAPYPVNPGDQLQIAFFSDAEPGQQISSVAEVAPDGSFTLAGPTGKGVPAGKYHITVKTIGGPGPASTTSGAPVVPATGGDKFQGKYSDPAKTPLTCEVTAANTEIVIDVGKGTASTGG